MLNDAGAGERLDCFVSVVAVLTDAGDIVEAFVRDLHAHLERHFSDYEILLVDRYSSDGTTERVQQLTRELIGIRYIELASRVHEDVASAAAMENAIGEYVIMMSPREDPVGSVLELVRLCRRGSEIVVGTAPYPRTFGYRMVRPLISWVLHGIGYDLPRNATNLRCMSRKVVNAVMQTGRFHHQFPVRISKTGYPQTVFAYTLKPGGRSRRTLAQGLRAGMHLLVFNSTRPLRWVTGLGLVGSLAAFVFSAYSVLVRLFVSQIVPGWTTTVVFSSFLFMLLFIILAFLGEYLGRLMEDRGEQRDYDAVFELNSSVMVNEARVNVLDRSTRDK